MVHFDMGTELELVKVRPTDVYRGSLVQLVNGLWLTEINGRHYALGTDGQPDKQSKWAGVWLDELDTDGEIIKGELLGYTRVWRREDGHKEGSA